MQLLIFFLLAFRQIFLPSQQSWDSWALLPIPFRVVGSNGLGPSTSRLSGVCSNQLSYEPMNGGGNRVRTDDPLLAGQVLYQLSYTPIHFALCENKCSPYFRKALLLKTNKKETIVFSDRLELVKRFSASFDCSP